MFQKIEKDHPLIKSDLIPNNCRIPIFLIGFSCKTQWLYTIFFTVYQVRRARKALCGRLESPKPDDDMGSDIFLEDQRCV